MSARVTTSVQSESLVIETINHSQQAHDQLAQLALGQSALLKLPAAEHKIPRTEHSTIVIDSNDGSTFRLIECQLSYDGAFLFDLIRDRWRSSIGDRLLNREGVLSSTG